MTGARVRVEGLAPLVRALKGPAFRDVNRELRLVAHSIASRTLLPLVQAEVAKGAAPQARAMAVTARAVRDRVPVVAVGRVNPRFNSGWARKGESAGQRRMRRGAMTRGVVVGPLGGHRDTNTAENYYRIPRDPTGGPLGKALREGGEILEAGEREYRNAYIAILAKYGFDANRVAG